MNNDRKISALPDNSSPTRTDYFPIDNLGVTKKMTLSGLTTFIGSTKEKAHYVLVDNTDQTGYAGWAGTYLKVSGTTTAQEFENFDLTVNNRATYIGDGVNKKFVVGSTIGMFSSSSNLFTFKLAVNGNLIEQSKVSIIPQYYGEAPPYGWVYISDVVTLNNGDYVELYVTNVYDDNLATVSEMNLTIEEF